MATVQQSIEHLFSLHKKLFQIFSRPLRFRLLFSGVETMKMIFTSFIILNCYICFNESGNNFVVRPPSIEEYLNLDEELVAAPEVSDEDLGEVYQYYRRNNNN